MPAPPCILGADNLFFSITGTHRARNFPRVSHTHNLTCT